MNKNALLLLVLFSFTNFIFSQCPTGNVILSTQTDVNNFINDYSTCEIIDGDLEIGNVTDISGISSIKRIEGTLRINYSNLTTLSNFYNLEYIGNHFEVINNQNLVSIENFNSLQFVGGTFVIDQNNSLTTIKEFNALTDIGNFFNVIFNVSLLTISDFDNLTNVSGGIGISGNNALLSIPNFNQLSGFMSSLYIIDNNSLLTLEGFNSIVKITVLEIIDNNSLIRISGFSNLEEVSVQMKIGADGYEEQSLIEIPEFDNLSIIGGGLEITNTKLTSLTGFNNIQEIGSLDPDWRNLYIINNSELISIDGFNNLSKVYGVFGISSCSNLTSIIGFSNLVEVNSIAIAYNLSLQTLSGLENLVVVGESGSSSQNSELSIAGNSELSDCSALCNLFENGVIYGSVLFQNNPSQCSSEAEVISICSPDFDNDGILDEDDLDDDNDGILDIIEQNGDITRDTDNDGFPDYRDIDSDNDGCFDVVEAGFTDGDSNGTLGDLPDTVDINGLIIGEPDGYDIPADVNTDTIYDFQQNILFDAGENGNLEICINANTVNLIDYLTGTPDLNGIWSPSLASGTSIFDPSIDVAGTYTYTVSNGACGTESAEVEVTIINVSINTDFDIIITEVDLNYYNIEIDINPVSNYLYSINGIDFQLQNTFNNLIGGNYTIYANEIEGCENFVKDISLLYFPNFFTPNNDGVNDVWKVDSLINQEYSIRIFDRFGKLITILNRFNNSWDGNFNSQKLPSTDYWFVATLTEGRIYKGHLTLKR